MAKKFRSAEYQYQFNEHSYDPDIMDVMFSSNITTPTDQIVADELKQLKQGLIVEYMRLAKEVLTERYFRILELMLQNYTQMEIAKILGINQSGVHKAINGNKNYLGNGLKTKTYGGLIKRLKESVKTDKKIQSMLNSISILSED
jgi:DNA-binding CsgD family transcriptional regulator